MVCTGAISPVTCPRLKARAFTSFKPYCICLFGIPLSLSNCISSDSIKINIPFCAFYLACSKSVAEAFLSKQKSARKPFVSKGFRALFSQLILLPLFFGDLLWLICALNIIPNGNFEPVFPPIISFLKIFVAENVAKFDVG